VLRALGYWDDLWLLYTSTKPGKLSRVKYKRNITVYIIVGKGSCNTQRRAKHCITTPTQQSYNIFLTSTYTR